MPTMQEANDTIRKLSERLSLEDDEVVGTLVQIYSYAAQTQMNLIAGLHATLRAKGYEPAYATAYAIAAAAAASDVLFDARNDMPEDSEFCCNDELTVEMRELYVKYNAALKENEHAKAADTTDNIIHGLFGREPGKKLH